MNINNKLSTHIKFSVPCWDALAGIKGAYVATSCCGKFEAIAEPDNNYWKCWIVEISSGLEIASGEILSEPTANFIEGIINE